MIVPFIPNFKSEEASLLMDNYDRTPINHQPWNEYRTSVKSNFTIAHTGNHLLINFFQKKTNYAQG